MLTIITILLIVSIFVSYCMCRHFANTKEFNPLWFNLSEEQREAEKREIKPLFKPYKVPFWHETGWWANWIAVIGVICLVVWLLKRAI